MCEILRFVNYHAGPLLRTCVRHAAIDRYRLGHYDKECTPGDQTIAQAADTRAAANSRGSGTDISSERFFWLLDTSTC